MFNRLATLLVALAVGFGGCDDGSPPSPNDRAKGAATGPVYVEPGDDLQAALNRAATATTDRRLVLRSGEYRIEGPSYCLLAVTAKHDGVTIEGESGAVLSARSSADPNTAAVAHVIYCGDGLTSATMIRHLVVTGAKGLATNANLPVEEYGRRAASLSRGLFYFMDGGAVKVYGQSAPTFEAVVFENNETNLCGGAVSIEQQGFRTHPVTFRNCRFLRNRCPGTGSAVDVLEGGAASFENCLFAHNVANYGMDQIAREYGLTYNEKHGTGALTVFPKSDVTVVKCTFTANWNGADDRGQQSQFQDCIFAANNATDGSRPGHPYELDILNAAGVRGCYFFSEHADLRGTISPQNNQLNAPDPEFDDDYIPQNPMYRKVGFRP